jgi:hypothetical protein
MTRHFRIQDGDPTGPLQLEQIKLRSQLHYRIGQTLTVNSRKIFGSESLDYLTQNTHSSTLP